MGRATESGGIAESTASTPGRVPPGMVRVSPMREAFAVLREFGVDPNVLLAEFGLHESYFRDPDNTVPYVIVGMFLKRCGEVTNCRHFGLLGGCRLAASNLGAVGFLMQSARDLRSSLNQMARYFRFHNPNATLQLSEAGGVAAWRFSLLMPRLEGREHILEAAMAHSVNTLRKLCGPKWEPQEVRLATTEPADRRPYLRAFGRSVRFNTPDTELLFASHWLDAPLPTADAAMQEAMLKQLSLLEAAEPEDLISQVRRMLPSLVSARAASLQVIAHLMGVSGRTLVRRLAAEGTTYMRLREEARYVAACQLLESTRLPANEISDRLGYSNPSAFTRAFHRWSGKPPADWRLSRRTATEKGEARTATQHGAGRR